MDDGRRRKESISAPLKSLAEITLGIRSAQLRLHAFLGMTFIGSWLGRSQNIMPQVGHF